MSSFDGIRNYEKENNYKLEVFVKNASGGEIASKLSGYFVLNHQKFLYKAIAFGRIGGHNIGIKISKKALEDIRKMGLDSEAILLNIQRKLIEGDITLLNAKTPKI